MRRSIALLGIAFVLAASVGSPAFAAKSGGSKTGGGKGGHTTASYTGSFSLVLLNSTDGTPHYGQQVTFNVTSNAPYYFVELDCSQSGTVVYQQTDGFYPGWAWSQTYTLQSAAWTGGGADCVATLYSSNSDGTNRQNLASMSFPVYA